MLKKVQVIFLFAYAAFVTGCSGSSSGISTLPGDVALTPLPAAVTLESTPMILDPSKLPPAPDPALNDATIAGVDSNNNGIRDDVERWIAQTYPTSAKMRAAMAQMALNSQKEITTPKLTRDTAYQIALEGMDATNCVGDMESVTGQKWNIKNYMAQMYSTRARYSALIDFQNTMGSRAFSVPQVNTCSIPDNLLPN